MRRALATMALLTVLLAGCGGDSDEAQPSPTTPTSASGPTTPGSVDTNFTGQDSERFCQLVRTYDERRTQVGTADATQLRELLTDGDRAIKESVAAAPAEIKGYVQVVADAFTGFLAVLAKANYDILQVPPDSLSGLSRPEVQEAAERLEAYAQKVCGITPTSLP